MWLSLTSEAAVRRRMNPNLPEGFADDTTSPDDVILRPTTPELKRVKNSAGRRIYSWRSETSLRSATLDPGLVMGSRIDA